MTSLILFLVTSRFFAEKHDKIQVDIYSLSEIAVGYPLLRPFNHLRVTNPSHKPQRRGPEAPVRAHGAFRNPLVFAFARSIYYKGPTKVPLPTQNILYSCGPRLSDKFLEKHPLSERLEGSREGAVARATSPPNGRRAWQEPQVSVRAP